MKRTPLKPDRPRSTISVSLPLGLKLDLQALAEEENTSIAKIVAGLLSHYNATEAAKNEQAL